LGPGWKHLKYPFAQVQNLENEIQRLESLISPNAESGGTQMRMGGGFGTVPSAMARIQLGAKMRQFKVLFPQPPNAENEIQRLGNLFSPNVESAGTDMGIGVDLLLCHQELLGISWNLVRNT